jgi:hypothetical protein
MAQFMEVGPTHRELAAFDLAERLFFKLEKKGDGYSLCREVGEFAPANDLSLEEVSSYLNGGNFRALTAASYGAASQFYPLLGVRLSSN